jgi:hypothetical protein
MTEVQSLGHSIGAFHQWLAREIVPEPLAFLALPATPPQEGASLVLTSIIPKPMPQGRKEIALVEATFLLSVSFADGVKSATLAGKLAFLLQEGQWLDGEGKMQPLALEGPEAVQALSRAFGLKPALALLVNVPFARARVSQPAKPVLIPLKIITETLDDLDGELIGTSAAGGRQPLVGADIAAVGLPQKTRTDHRGRFWLQGLPGGAKVTLVIGFKSERHEVLVPGRGHVVVEMPIDALML